LKKITAVTAPRKAKAWGEVNPIASLGWFDYSAA
jgi:hypothetical protein